MKKRTSVDFSNHELEIAQYDGISIYKFKKPNTIINMLVFVNTNGITSVTGDFGNWIFCREFHPSQDEYVSDGYQDEKLEINSIQKSHIYDSEKTLKSIEDFKNSFEDMYGREMDDEELNQIENIEQYVDDEREYIIAAYYEKPNSIDYEDIPFSQSRHRYLNIVYDGFDAICEYMKNKNI